MCMAPQLTILPVKMESSPVIRPKHSEERDFLIPRLEFLLKRNAVYTHRLLLLPLHFTADVEITILFSHSKVL